MITIIFAIISGISMTLQGVLNTRLSSKIGIWETNVFVQASALVITLLVSFFLGNGNYKAIRDVNKPYLFGGILGVIIIFTVMKSIDSMGATCAIAIILIAQLASAAIVDAFGLFGTDKISFGFKEIIGVLVMISGIIIFKWK
jgi:transporter family-2 protein